MEHSGPGTIPVVLAVVAATFATYGVYRFISGDNRDTYAQRMSWELRREPPYEPNRDNVPPDWEVRPSPPLNPNRHNVPQGWRVE